MDDERRPRGRQRHQQPRHDQQIDERRPTRDEQHHGTGERQAGDRQPRHARSPPPEHAVPGRRAGDQHAAQQAQAARELAHRHRDRERDVAAPTTSATNAASRRLIGSHPLTSANVESAAPRARRPHWIEDAERIDLAIYAGMPVPRPPRSTSR